MQHGDEFIVVVFVCSGAAVRLAALAPHAHQRIVAAEMDIERVHIAF